MWLIGMWKAYEQKAERLGVCMAEILGSLNELK